MTRATLILRLSAPIQSWGTGQAFKRRPAGDAPNAGAVAGLIANAMGRTRADPIDDLKALEFRLRAVRPPAMGRDYHTVDRGRLGTVETVDGLLMDAVWLVALTGDPALLKTIRAAFENPARPVYLGRRSQPPDAPIVDQDREVVDGDPDGLLARAAEDEKRMLAGRFAPRTRMADRARARIDAWRARRAAC
ncbi:type I-E CRISPR-associated protein Cas5/CasD [Bifidobacterium myosotis]|nr:type I-E CRISPR-associated protein Cas5/CasD [Bifidobacterium myosotis]